jgi:Tfp pilus assembly protein PilX
MNKQTHFCRGRSGTALIVVMGLTALVLLAATSMALSINARARLAFKQVDMERAFYVAAAGAERAATHVAKGNEVSTTLTGSIGGGSYVSTIQCISGAGEVQINVTSVGTVNGVSRTVTMRGLRRVSWARYALWYDSEATKLWMFPGERFDGRVYSRPQLHFHDLSLATKGQVRFTDRAWSAASSIEKASSAVNPIFSQGLTLSAAVESMASVNFTDLQSKATSGGLVLDGATTIVISGSNLTITNERKAWTNKVQPIPANGTIYVRTVTSGTTSTRTGDITISAPSGLTGRLTLVSDNDIKIVNHIKYTSDPRTIPTSTDAIGLIAKRNVSVQTSAPNNLQVFGHIICQSGGFGVVNYNTGSARGTLTLYGGLVNQIRNGVNTNGGATGYAKDYNYDVRFAKNPPPNYPVLTDELEWTGWQG